MIAPRIAAKLVTRVRTPGPSALTRETEVLRLVARGMTNAAIGRALFIGDATVATHLLRMFGKFGVDDRTGAVTAAIEHGILPAPGR